MSRFLEDGQSFAGRYRVERLLAEGGMGAVYVATDETTDQQVALKIISPHALAAVGTEKLELEAKVAAWTKSPHIVKVLHAGRDAETKLPFLVMELLAGRSLDAVVHEDGPLPPSLVVAYLEQVARGLDRAHAHVGKDGRKKPIVHRDLKPENLFLATVDGQEPVVKILDFGIAKAVSETSAVSKQVLGTPLYISYEQVTGDPVSEATDVWALGLIAFYLLTGRSYWKVASREDAGEHALYAEIMHGTLEPPSTRALALGLTPTWPPAFDDWFLRVVNRAPFQRPGSAGAAAAALRDALLGSVQLVADKAGLDRTAASSPPSSTTTVAVSESPRALHATPAAHSHTRPPEPPRPASARLRSASPALVAGLLVAVAGLLALSKRSGEPAASPGATAAAPAAVALPPQAATPSSLAPAGPASVPVPRPEPSSAPGRVVRPPALRPHTRPSGSSPAVTPPATSPVATVSSPKEPAPERSPVTASPPAEDPFGRR